MTETKDLLEEIYQSLDRAEALTDLAPQDKGAYYLLTCPACGKREAFVYKDGTRITCNRRENCGLSQSLWNYVQGSRKLSNQETLRELAKLAGYTLPDLDPEAVERLERARAQANAWESSLDHFRAELWEEKGRAVRDYLKGRGYSDNEIRGMELGLFTSAKDLSAYLKGRGIKGDEAEPVLKALENITKAHKLAIPYRDPAGRVRGVIVRATDGTEPKYLYTLGLKRDAPFNLDRARGRSELIVVEGYLDALAVRERAGLVNVIALGDTSLSETKLDQAVKYGAKAFVLALDNDKAGADGTERALELLRKRDLRAYVLTLPDGTKDPDEFIKANGPEAFVELSRNPQSGARWKAGRILARYDIGTDKGRDLALEEAIAYEDGLADPIESKDLMDEITRGLGLSLELLEHRLRTYKEKRARAELRNGYQELFTKGPELLEAGDLDELREYTGEKTRELQAKAVTKTAGPYTLDLLEADIAQTRPGLKTGYKSLDELFLIPPEAITIIGARPSHGKTTLLMNLLLNMARTYTDQNFFFFSYEESRKQIGVKLLNILSGETIDRTRNVQALEDYLRAKRTDRTKVEEGKAELRELTEAKRLWIIDEPLYVDELADALAYYRERYNIGAVFIDYIQKIKIRGRYPTRQVELQRISERILETAKGLSMPIVLGAQLGRDPLHKDKVRLDNLRESGDIEQDANLVLGLLNPAMEKAQDEGGGYMGDEVELTLTVLKNRNGLVNEERLLTFNRPLLTIKDSRAGSYSGR
jgi:DNA primase